MPADASRNGAGGAARQPALELTDITAGYGEFTALWNVSVEVPGVPWWR